MCHAHLACPDFRASPDTVPVTTNISNQNIEFMVRSLWPSDTMVSLLSPAFPGVEEMPLSVMMMLFFFCVLCISVVQLLFLGN